MLFLKKQDKGVASLNRLLNLENRRAYRLALRITNNHADAEDVLQESLLKACLNLSQFRGESRLSTWLATIVTHEAVTLLRRRNSRREVSLESNLEREDESGARQIAVDPAESPELRAMREEFRKMLAETIEELSPKFRVVLVMGDMCGFSLEEMAGTLELSKPATKARLFQARRKLQKHIHKRMGAPGRDKRGSRQ